MAEAGLLAAAVALFLGTAALLVRLVRNPARVRDAQLALNANPVVSLLTIVLGVLLVVLVLALGIAWIATGHGVVGWALVCLGATGVAHLAVGLWIRRKPIA